LRALRRPVTAHAVAAGPGIDAGRLTIESLASSWARPCYDWWEEHIEQVHVPTLGSLLAGLRAAETLPGLDAATVELARSTASAIDERLRTDGVLDGHLVKWVGTDAVDASLASIGRAHV